MTGADGRVELAVCIGGHSRRGTKGSRDGARDNQDFHGAIVPGPPLSRVKGIAVALADGISSSEAGGIAAETAVSGFLDDFYATSETWSTRTSAERVIAATNAWLYAQTVQGRDRHDRDRGWVCTFDALIVKSNTAYVFHVGDARISRVRGTTVEPLTDEHRVRLSSTETHLARALGAGPRIDIDHATVPLEAGDVFVLATDGVHEWVSPAVVADAVARHRDALDDAAKAIVDEAARRGSGDDLTVQLVAIERLPDPDASEWLDAMADLPLPPPFAAGQRIDGFELVRELHATSRSHVWLARESASGAKVVLKTPSTGRDGKTERERFLLQEWIARRIDDPHVVRVHPVNGTRSALYVVTAFVDGQTLAQWLVDRGRPDLATVRAIVEQVATGLRAFHRQETLHLDLRPENVMIDGDGAVTIIDFGSARTAGLDEVQPLDAAEMAGTPQYAAPETFLGDAPTIRADVFSLGAMAYRMLSGDFPYGTDVAKAKSRRAQRRLRYRSVLAADRAIPAWVDGALRRAVRIDPADRYAEPAEFVHDLRVPNPSLVPDGGTPWIERDPELFWKAACLVLVVVVAALAFRLATRG